MLWRFVGVSCSFLSHWCLVWALPHCSEKKEAASSAWQKRINSLAIAMLPKVDRQATDLSATKSSIQHFQSLMILSRWKLSFCSLLVAIARWIASLPTDWVCFHWRERNYKRRFSNQILLANSHSWEIFSPAKRSLGLCLVPMRDTFHRLQERCFRNVLLALG